MEIKDLDKNFANNNILKKGNFVNVPSDKVNLYGVIYDKERGFIRFPHEIASTVSEGVLYLSEHTAGGRIAFKTNSTKIKIIVTYDALEKMYHMPLTGQAGFTLLEVKNGKEFHRFTYTVDFGAQTGYESTSRKLPGRGMRNYVLYFPLYNKVKTLTLEIDKKADIEAFNPYKDVLPILYYGSSITQGGCASRPDNSYQSMITKQNRIDHINLGFSGNARGEKTMAEYLANTKCSIFVMDYDHNAPSVEHLEQTHETMFKTFRAKQPSTPVIFLSAPNFYVDKKTYIPRRNIIKRTYENAVHNGDKNVYFIDGSTIYPKAWRESCAVDDAHPNDLGFSMFAKKLLPLIFLIK